MKISRSQIGFIFSTIALMFVIVQWSDLFLFSYVYKKPDWPWLEWVPTLHNGADCIAFLSLIPAAIIPPTLRLTFSALCKTILLASLMAVLIQCRNNGPFLNSEELISNAFFTYFWVIATAFLIPSIVLFALRAAFDSLMKFKKYYVES
jgi:hypothetical protein